MAALYSWKESYCVNIQNIDLQHQKLFALINELHESMIAGKANTVMGKTLTGLIQYAKTHFKDEEDLMARVQYPELAKHKSIHDAFLSKAADLQRKFGLGNITLSIETMRFLGDWVKNHILQTDMQYGAYIASRKC